MHPTVARVVEMLTAAGGAGQARMLPGSARTAGPAGDRLGCPHAVFRTTCAGLPRLAAGPPAEVAG